MKTTRNTLNELLATVREHPPRRPLHSTEELQALTATVDARPGTRAGRFGSRALAWIATATVAVTVGGYFAVNGSDAPTTAEPPTARAIAPSVAAMNAPDRPSSLDGTGTPPSPNHAIIGQERQISPTTTSTAAVIGKPHGLHDSQRGNGGPIPPTPQMHITFTTRDSTEAARHAAQARAHRNPALDISGIDYLTLTPEELECIGVRTTGSALEVTAEEEIVLDTPKDVKQANDLGFETDGGTCILRSQIRIDTFNVDDVKQRGRCPDRFSPLAPVIVINQYVQTAASEGSIMYYFNRSPILRKYIGSSKMEKDELDYVYDASRRDGTQSSVNKNRYAIMSKLIPVYIRIGDQPIAGSSLRRGADVCLWYYPTPEFLSALPDRYRIPLQKELDVIADVEQRKLPEGEVCVRLTGEPTFLGYCRKSSGALARTGVYPNPASERITCHYVLTESRDIRISLHDLSGRFLRSLDERESQAGEHDDELSLKGVESGAYLIAIRTDRGEQAVQRIIVQ